MINHLESILVVFLFSIGVWYRTCHDKSGSEWVGSLLSRGFVQWPKARSAQKRFEHLEGKHNWLDGSNGLHERRWQEMDWIIAPPGSCEPIFPPMEHNKCNRAEPLYGLSNLGNLREASAQELLLLCPTRGWHSLITKRSIISWSSGSIHKSSARRRGFYFV